MAEVKQNVRTLLVNYACDRCSIKPNPGCILEKTGRNVLVYPMKYEYKCPSCNELFWMEESYPTVKYEVVEEN